MLMKAQLKEIIRGLSQGVVGGWKGSVEGNSSTCKKGIRPDLILTRGPHNGNEPCHISPSDLIVATMNESWRITKAS